MSNGMELLITFVAYFTGLIIGWKLFGFSEEDPQDQMLIITLSITMFLLYLVAKI